MRQTLELGLTPCSLPARLGVTYTAGSNDLSNANTQTILSAAMALLPNFQLDWREFESMGRVKLVEAFIKRDHPLWFFNNAVTLTLWALVPGRTGVDLKVICFIHSHCRFTRQNAMPSHVHSGLQI